MSFKLILSVVFSLCTIVDANRLSFSKYDGWIYAETDQFHYALYGQITDNDGIRIISVDEGDHFYQKSNCESKWQELNKIDPDYVPMYKRIRETYLKLDESRKNSPGAYTWHEYFYEDMKEFSAVRIDDETVIISSKYFPGRLAKVIISGDIIVFVHYDGRVRIKTNKCLSLNEKILISGINKINLEGKKSSCFHFSNDKPLKTYMKSQSFNSAGFDLEQNFSKIYTKQEIAAADNAVKGVGVRSDYK